MHKKFEVNWTKIKGGCQSERKVSQLNSYSKMPLSVKQIADPTGRLHFLAYTPKISAAADWIANSYH